MRTMKILLGLLALLGAPAHAANLYVGAGLGGGMPFSVDSNVRDGRALLANTAATHITYDKLAVAPAVLVGFDVNKYFGGEFQYAYLGNYQLKASMAGGGVAKETDNVHAWSFSAVGRYWLGPKFHLLGKLGFADTVVDMGCSIPGKSCNSGTDSGVGLVFGVGIGLVPAKELEIRVDYTHYSSVGNQNRDYTAGSFGLIETLAIYHF